MQATPGVSDPEFDFRPFFLHRGRLALYDRIETRVEEMVGGGVTAHRQLQTGEGQFCMTRPGLAPGGDGGWR
jgi:hypothetical protein